MVQIGTIKPSQPGIQPGTTAEQAPSASGGKGDRFSRQILLYYLTPEVGHVTLFVIFLFSATAYFWRPADVDCILYDRRGKKVESRGSHLAQGPRRCGEQQQPASALLLVEWCRIMFRMQSCICIAHAVQLFCSIATTTECICCMRFVEIRRDCVTCGRRMNERVNVDMSYATGSSISLKFSSFHLPPPPFVPLNLPLLRVNVQIFASNNYPSRHPQHQNHSAAAHTSAPT